MKLKGNRPFKPLFPIWSSNIHHNTFQSPTDCNSSESLSVTQKSILTDVVCLSLKMFQKNARQMHPIYGFIKFQILTINISRCSLLLFYFIFSQGSAEVLLPASFGRKMESRGSVTASSAARESELVLAALERQSCLHPRPLETRNETGNLRVN